MRADQRRTRTRGAILDATAQLLVDQPLGGLTVDGVAVAAGVSVGSIYVHFGSKDGLVYGLLERALCQAHRTFEPPADMSSPFDRAMWAVEAWIRLAAASPPAARLVLFNVLEPPEGDLGGPERTSAREQVREHLGALRNELESSVALGELGGIDPHAAVGTVLAWVDGLLLSICRRGAAPDAEAMALRSLDAMAALLRTGARA